MSFAQVLRNRNVERGLVLVAALGMLMSLLVIFAPAARAHHPTTVAGQICEDGLKYITFTSTSWKTDGTPGSGHDDVRIEVSVNGGAWTEVASGAYESPDYSFSGQFLGEDYIGQTIQVRSQVVGPWDNGGSPGNGHPDATTEEFIVPDDCAQEASVAVSHENCDFEYGEGFLIQSGGVNINIDPESGATVTVTGPDNFEETYTTSGFYELEPGAYSWTAEAQPGYELTGDTGGEFTVLDCSWIFLIKQVIDWEEGDVTEFGFTSEDLDDLFETEGTTVFLHHDGIIGGPVPPGSYDVIESVIPEGYEFVSITCDDGDSGQTGDATATYVVAQGEVVTCTFFNQEEEEPPVEPEPGFVRVIKDVVSGDLAAKFEFVGDVSGEIGDGENIELVVPVGETVSSTEIVPEGWELTNISCISEGGTWEVDLENGTVDMTVTEEAGGVVCTFSNVESEVEALVIVTVGGECVENDGNGSGQIDVSMSVPGGATVVIKSGNTVVETLTDDGVVTVPEGQTYTWEATANEGFEFPVGFVPNGTVAIEVCSIEELPLTGLGTTELFGISLLLLGVGGLTLFATRARREET